MPPLTTICSQSFQDLRAGFRLPETVGREALAFGECSSFDSVIL